MPIRTELQKKKETPGKVLLLGSGGLSIGQAGEFDYSGTQALKALIEENLEVILVNPNIATVQTNPIPGVRVYLYPVEPKWVERIIEKEKPDAIIAGFGGQTALNCLIQLDQSGVLKKHGILNLGSSVETLKLTEDRDEFAKKMREIGIPVPPSAAVQTLEEALKASQKIGFPLIVRAAYALGGLGSGFANDEEELTQLVISALAYSPQVLLEKSLKGWKEVEYEVMRDSEENTITICNMENFDPLGIHTGDSIVVCPSQSLSDEDYQKLRNASFKITEALGILGECNVQFALSPHSHEFYVIEVNARLSRSSALASKASGYPIAYIAAKVVLGFDLLELKNPVTGITYAYYEPALDYITIKIPRWDLTKFKGVKRELGSTMKSVGEIMAIGRSFPEAIQKAIRMVTEQSMGLLIEHPALQNASLENEIEKPTDARFFAVMESLRKGTSLDRLHEKSAIDKWFLSQLKKISDTEHTIVELALGQFNPSKSKLENLKASLSQIDSTQLKKWKRLGFSDTQLTFLLLKRTFQGEKVPSSKSLLDLSLEVRKKRKELKIQPVVKKIDTTAGEYPSPSNYLYLTYSGSVNDEVTRHANSKKVGVVLGSGSYRIGSSVEFDWCAVSSSNQLRAAGWESAIINCNPETVSTDYNSSDRLYFEELTLERILDIVDFESPEGVIVSMGGQLPNRLSLPLVKAGVKLLGHSPESIDQAEDRSKFSKLLDELKIDQPRWIAASNREEMLEFISKVGFPVLIRPSYVLSGAAMNVATDQESLDNFLRLAVDVSRDHPIVVSEFVAGAREIELDGIAQNGEILTSVVSEHIENAGVHSGDATMVVPAQKLYVETVRQVRRAGRAIAKELKLNGPFNIQFLAKRNQIKVIECNVRAARSFPFVSKVVGLNLADAATQIMMGTTPKITRLNEDELPYVGVKAAMFSFTRLGGADPVLGVEMASTGEVGCIAETFQEALLLALEASGVKKPKHGVLVSSGPEKDKLEFLRSARILKKLNIPMYATTGTAHYLNERGFSVTPVMRSGEGEGPSVIELIRTKKVDLVINIPKNLKREELTFGYQIRQAAIRYGASLFTNMEKTTAFVEAWGAYQALEKTHKLVPLPKFR